MIEFDDDENVGQFINFSGFTDQLSKNNDDDAGLDVRAILTRYDKDGAAILFDPVETIIYGPAGEVYVHDVDDIVIQPRGRACINAMINVKIPKNCYGRLASRSGLSKKYGIEVGAGVIDVSYTGFVSVILYNHGFFPYVVRNGDRIAQLITEYINLNRYEEVDELDETTRGSAGFGSSGV